MNPPSLDYFLSSVCSRQLEKHQAQFDILWLTILAKDEKCWGNISGVCVVCVCLLSCNCVCMCAYVRMCAYVCLSVYACMYVCVHVCV